MVANGNSLLLVPSTRTNWSNVSCLLILHWYKQQECDQRTRSYTCRGSRLMELARTCPSIVSDEKFFLLSAPHSRRLRVNWKVRRLQCFRESWEDYNVFFDHGRTKMSSCITRWQSMSSFPHDNSVPHSLSTVEHTSSARESLLLY